MGKLKHIIVTVAIRAGPIQDSFEKLFRLKSSLARLWPYAYVALAEPTYFWLNYYPWPWVEWENLIMPAHWNFSFTRRRSNESHLLFEHNVSSAKHSAQNRKTRKLRRRSHVRSAGTANATFFRTADVCRFRKAMYRLRCLIWHQFYFRGPGARINCSTSAVVARDECGVNQGSWS